MNRDITISLAILIGCIFFILSHATLMRIGNKSSVVNTLLISWIGATVVSAAILLLFAAAYFQVIIAMLVSSSITFVCIASYIVSFFGIATSAVRTRMLFVIAKKEGITKKEIMTLYNCAKDVHTRIERYIKSGEVVKQGNLYVYKQSHFFSPVQLHGWMIQTIRKLYGLPPHLEA